MTLDEILTLAPVVPVLVVDDIEHAVPLGRARVAREGASCTVLAYGAMVPVAAEAAAEAAQREWSVEIVDLRTLVPLDAETVLASVRKTGRVVIVHEAPRTCGYGGELAALIAEQALTSLLAPVLRAIEHVMSY